jgi:hypothetical protein
MLDEPPRPFPLQAHAQLFRSAIAFTLTVASKTQYHYYVFEGPTAAPASTRLYAHYQTANAHGHESPLEIGIEKVLPKRPGHGWEG